MSETSTQNTRLIEAGVADESYFEHLLASFMKLQEAYVENNKYFTHNSKFLNGVT